MYRGAPAGFAPATVPLTAAERREFLDELAAVFTDQDDASLVLGRLDFPAARRPTWTTGIRFWTAITEELDKGIMHEPYDRLLREALDFYPTNSVFGRLAAGRWDSPDRAEVSPEPPSEQQRPGPKPTASELRGRLRAYRAKASRLGFAEDDTLLSLYATANAALTSRPVNRRRAEAAVHAYERAVHARDDGGSGAREGTDR
ncbi:hypothetical protein I6A60_35730 [Frankia sp. AgB1.9]|uniref:effector-associated domain EAD1-containing protein n=1 Tax=unclassified Frankia TaxID=2632575 RepID=UPI0019321931|nr:MULTISPECIES: effector-associated domain EAD1-containing protein [unclassified Frankia]MBL7489988.1 hypothetical protein [Frankia sp. AgW1.1]MBL7553164.1 hypothetical protein [Frankia sp. AgB1.9]